MPAEADHLTGELGQPRDPARWAAVVERECRRDPSVEEEQRLADSRARGIPVRQVREDENIWTGERSYSILKSRSSTTLRVRHRGARQQRPASSRTRGSRRCAARSQSRAGPDDPDESGPEQGPLEQTDPAVAS